MDKWLVTMLSTIHNDSIVSKHWRSQLASRGIEEVQKPVMVEQYNTHMGGMDTTAAYALVY